MDAVDELSLFVGRRKQHPSCLPQLVPAQLTGPQQFYARVVDMRARV